MKINNNATISCNINATCIPVLLYGCESWTLTETSLKTLNYLVRTFYRIICGAKQSETHMTNEELYRKVKQRQIIGKKKIEIYWSLFKNVFRKTGKYLRVVSIKDSRKKKIGSPKYFNNFNKK